MHPPLTSSKLFCTWNFLPTHHKYLKHANTFIGVDRYWLSSLAGQMRLRVFPDPFPQLEGYRHSPSSLGMPAGRGFSSPNPDCFCSGATDPGRKTSIAFQGFPRSGLHPPGDPGTSWMGFLVWGVFNTHVVKTPIRGEWRKVRNRPLYQNHFSSC